MQCPLPTRCQEHPLPSCDKQKCHQTLPHVPWGARLSPAENHRCRAIKRRKAGGTRGDTAHGHMDKSQTRPVEQKKPDTGARAETACSIHMTVRNRQKELTATQSELRVSWEASAPGDGREGVFCVSARCYTVDTYVKIHRPVQIRLIKFTLGLLTPQLQSTHKIDVAARASCLQGRLFIPEPTLWQRTWPHHLKAPLSTPPSLREQHPPTYTHSRPGPPPQLGLQLSPGTPAGSSPPPEGMGNLPLIFNCSQPNHC